MSAKHSYPMSILLITVAVCAIQMATCVSGRDFSETTQGNVLTCVACGVFAGMLGALIGLHSYRRFARMVSGFVIGLVIGLTAGIMVFSDSSAVLRINITQILGCIGLVLFAVYFKASTSEPLWNDDQN